MRPKTTLVLHALQSAGDAGLTTGELVDVGGSRFGARVGELREAGYSISQHRERQGRHRYHLHASPTAQSKRPLRRIAFATPALCLRCGLGGQDPNGSCSNCDDGLLLSVIGYAAEQDTREDAAA